MKTKIHKILGVALALVLVFGLLGAFVPTKQVEAQAYTPNQWNTLSIPSPGGLVLADGSDITDFAAAADGTTIYVVDDALGAVYKSTNGGYSFSTLTITGSATPKLVAVAPDDPNAVAVVDSAGEVWVSNNGGAAWATMGAPAGTGEVVSDIAVSPARTGTILGRDYAVSTYSETGWGDIYVVGTTATWAAEATSLGLDFTSVALAPNWAGDRVVLAVGSDASPGGTTEVSGATVGDSWLVAINVATHALAGPGMVSLDAAASDSPAAFGSAILEPVGTGTAGWSTAQVDTGTYSAMLTCSGTGLNEWSAAKVPYGKTLATLEALTATKGSYTVLDVGFKVYAAASGWVPYAMLWVDEDADGTVDTRLTGGFDVNNVGTPANPTTSWTDTWYKTSAAIWQLRNYDAGVISTYSGTNTNLTDSLPGYLADGGANAIVVYVGVGYTNNANPAYVDDIVIGGTTYALEDGSVALAGEIVSSSITLPADFDSTSVGNFRAYVGWTSVKSGTVILCADDAYRVDFNSVRKLEIRPSVGIQSLSYFGTIGSGTLMAGESATTGVWFSSDPMSGMPSWGAGSAKGPTGETNTVVALTSDTEAFAGTSGDNSGFHKSLDGGLSFNGLSLIDEVITTITDVMPSPDGSTIFMATADSANNDSLWRGVGFPSPGSWQRVHFRTVAATQFPGASTLIRLSPDYDTDSTLYWFDAGTGAGQVIRRSTNAGQIFGGRTAPKVVADAAIESQDVLYVINAGNVYTSTNGGWFFGLPTNAGLGDLYDIAMAPSYPNTPVAGNLLVGGLTAPANVALSTDGAATFAPLLSGIGGSPAKLQVLGDEDYASNNIVYAASNTATQGIWRYNVGTSSAWEQIDAVAGQMTGLAQEGGVLYGSWTGAGEAGAEAVDADSFRIYDPSTNGGDNGTVTVTTGSVLVTPNGTATVQGGAVAVTLTAGGSCTWIIGSTSDPDHDYILVEALADNTNGIWTRSGSNNAQAGIFFDDDDPDDAWVLLDGGAFSLPDAAVEAGEGEEAASGVERTLLPTVPSYVSAFWDVMDVGSETATFSAAPSALRVAGNGNSISLWAIDTPATLMAYNDEMALAKSTVTVPSVVPFDSVTGGNAEFTISWTNIANALFWQLEICTDSGCTQRVVTTGTAYVPPLPPVPTYTVAAATLVAGADYYTRVRVRDQVPGDAIRSQWSEVQKFSVTAGEKVTVSYLGVQPLGPVPGAIDVPMSPGFTWSPYADSTNYEFQLATDAGFTDILAEAKLATTGYKYEDKLGYATTYFWRARGIEPTVTDWSPVASFTTEKAPPAPPAPPPAPPAPPAPVVTPGIIWAIIAIGAILVIAVIVLILRTRRVA